MNAIRKIWKFISSMRFAIALLLLLAVACSIASLVPQGNEYAWYAERYSDRTAALILALNLDDAFHSWWFALITAFLSVNLLLCNVLRLPQLLRRTKAEGSAENALRATGDVSVSEIADPTVMFAGLRMPRPAACRTEDGREALFASKNRVGLWGAWVCHLGILLLILGFGLGQMTQQVYTVYGMPGQSKPIGDTQYALSIDDFRVDMREDGSARQYTADITVYNLEGGDDASRSATISVNHPAALYGMKFYQNSTGWAATVDVLKDGAPLQQEPLCAGEFLAVQDKPELVVMLNALYPDYVLQPGVGATTASQQLNNPAYLYSVYYQGQMLGMNALMDGEVLTIDEYTVTFSDPRPYTLIQIKSDRFTWLALAGGLVTMLGLLLALYLPPSRMWAIREDNGWTVFGQSRKGGAFFRERFMAAAGVDAQPKKE